MAASLKVGFHASHEQFAPSYLLKCVQAAEQAGFEAVMCSDHIQPWSEAQGQAGFAWAWLGAAMQATSLPFGVVTVPGNWRYHPAIIAQAAATLAEMFPERFWLAPGSGEALNEHVVGKGWPTKGERNTRLKAGVEIMRALWRGETVTQAEPIPTAEAKLYTRAQTPPALIGAAMTPATAAWLGEWADGLITATQPFEKLQAVVEAFKRGGGANKPMFLQAKLSYAPTQEAAEHEVLEQWHTNIFDSSVLSQLESPAQFGAVGKFVGLDDLKPCLCISADLADQLEWLKRDLALGFNEVYLHNVGRNQLGFIETFGSEILPTLKAL